MFRHLLRYLRACGAIAPAAPPPRVTSPWAEVVARYDRYLAEIYGLQPPTRRSYGRHAAQFLTWYQQQGTEELAALSAREVLAYLTVARSERAPRGHAKQIVTVLRSFLRFLWWEGVIPTALEDLVPTLRCWRWSSVPKHLAWEQVRALIDGIDTSTPIGKRDHAIVLLLAVLGLRNADVRRLELTHIAWREGEVLLPRTKAGRARRLPLPQEVGEALARYLAEGRPATPSPYVFVRHTAPLVGPLSPNGLARIITRHLQRLQIAAPRGGAHLLRHSLATRLVNTGVPIKAIADLLGHLSIDTTAIYTKVDHTRLAVVALPFPGGVR
jgi:site-specific recombinase XerD